MSHFPYFNRSHKFILVAVSVLAAVTLLAGCVFNWQKDVTVNGMHFKKYTPSSIRGDHIGYLSEDQVIQGYPCKKGFTTLWPDLTLCECQASSAFEFNGNEVPAGTWLIMSKEGYLRVCSFPKETVIQGYRCKGGGRLGATTGFYKSGRLESFYSRENLAVDGFECKGSLIALHENGSLRSCKLVSPAVIDGVSYEAGTKLVLDPEGHVEKEQP
jgi:hypothetical protein